MHTKKKENQIKRNEEPNIIPTLNKKTKFSVKIMQQDTTRGLSQSLHGGERERYQLPKEISYFDAAWNV